jgi:putative nucleotidyltransferase with HDIG domain
MSGQHDSEIFARISSVVGGIDALPTPPIVFTQIQNILNNPNASALDIASILQEDAGISAKVLRLTNSAYYGLTRTVESIRQAVVIIGLDAVKNLVLTASVFEMFSKKQIDPEFQDYFWRHSLATAFGARMLARNLNGASGFDAESGFSAGLLHDIGKMVISVYMPDERDRIKNLKSLRPNVSDHVVEGEILGYNHTQVGAVLGDKWQLPDKLVEAIEYHHYPQAAPNQQNKLPHLIHVTNYLAKLTFDTEPDEKTVPFELPKEEAMEALGISDQDIMAFALPLREEYFKAETFVAMARGTG